MHRLYPKNGGKFPKLAYSGYPALQESSKELITLEGKWIRYASDRGYGVPSICMRNDGKLLAAYWDAKNNKIYVSVIDDPMMIFTVDNCGNNPSEYEFTGFTINGGSVKHYPAFTSTANMRCSLVRNSIGELLLICCDPGEKKIQQRIHIFKSVSGNGNDNSDWELFSIAYESTIPNQSFSFTGENAEINNCQVLSNGRMIMGFGRLREWTFFHYVDWVYSVMYSDDDGINWNYSDITTTDPGITSVGQGISGIAEFANGIFTSYGYYHSGMHANQMMVYSYDYGVTWDLCDVITELPGENSLVYIKIYEGDFWNLLLVTRPTAINWDVMYSEKSVSLGVDGQSPYRGSNWKLLAGGLNQGWQCRYIQSIDVPDVGIIIVMLGQSSNMAGAFYGWYWR